MVRLLRIDSMVSGSNPPSAKLKLNWLREGGAQLENKYAMREMTKTDMSGSSIFKEMSLKQDENRNHAPYVVERFKSKDDYIGKKCGRCDVITFLDILWKTMNLATSRKRNRETSSDSSIETTLMAEQHFYSLSYQ